MGLGVNSSNVDPHGAMAWTVGPLSMYHRRSLDTGTNVYAGHPVCDFADAGWDGGRGTWITAGVGWAAWLHAGTVQPVSAVVPSVNLAAHATVSAKGGREIKISVRYTDRPVGYCCP